MIDLKQEYIEFIKNTINNELKSYKLFIFGSRAKSTAKEYSDIDIAISSDELTPEIKSRLEFLFEDSTLPYEVDIINLKTISDEFKNLIKNNLIEIL